MNSNTSEFDDFINISIATNTPTPSSSLCNQDVIKQGNTTIPEKQPAYSTGNTPEKKRTISYNEKSPKKAEKQDGKVEGSLSTPARMDPSKKKKRSKSDVGLILKDKEKLQQVLLIFVFIINQLLPILSLCFISWHTNFEDGITNAISSFK